METHFFILGRYPSLSLAEIIAVLDLKKLPYSLDFRSVEAAVFSVGSEFNLKEFCADLGGTVKSGRLIDKVLYSDPEDRFQNLFSSTFLKDSGFIAGKGKIKFAISLYDLNSDPLLLKRLEKRLTGFHATLKDNLQAQNLKVGFIKIKHRFTSSVSLVKNGVLKNGFEMSLLAGKEQIIAGRTLWVQDYESFTSRDFFKPAKDKRSGIMPVKLARMMLNLAGKERNSTIMDPFSGSGTIILEAYEMGFFKILGSDISIKAVSDTKQNLAWLTGSKIENKVGLLVTDVVQLSTKIPPQSVDAVVTEPFLGKPLHKVPDVFTVRQIFADLKPLYIAAFKNFNAVLKKDGRIVFIFPAFQVKGSLMLFDIEPFSNNFRLLSSRSTFLYRSKDQFLIREIAVFARK